MNSIVIGSGFGGIAAALRLKAKGHQVTLVEKHPDLGGRARVFKKNGFTFDGGPTVITAPYLINELFDLFKKERVRVAGVDTPEKRTRDLEEKELGIEATNWLKEKLDGAISGDDDLIIRTELVGGMGKYGRLLGWLYIGDAEVSLNEEMIEEGYAWAYDGGTKQKNFEELREIRRTKGTLL